MPTESPLRDAALRMHVRARIESGLLPVMVPQQINAGHGSRALRLNTRSKTGETTGNCASILGCHGV